MERLNGRQDNELRPVRFTRNFTEAAEGSVLVECGRTRILCTVSVVGKVPPFQKSKGEGWLTAEYAMLPGSVQGRKARETNKRDGRSVEIQRLIGRSLRASVDLSAFPGITLHVDCDVLQADGGTRCASITGAAVALHDALQTLQGQGQLTHWPMKDWPVAVSVGVVAGREVLDLDYGEDFEADVDMNVIGTSSGRIIEVQGTAEGNPFERAALDRLVDLGMKGVADLAAAQKEATEGGVQV